MPATKPASEIRPATAITDDLVGALSVREFCARYGISPPTFYEEIKAGRLRARKCGAKTLIAVADANYWLAHLPEMKPRRDGAGRPPAWTKQRIAEPAGAAS